MTRCSSSAPTIEPSKNALRGFLAFEALLNGGRTFAAAFDSSRSRRPAEDRGREYAEYAAAVREVVARINGLADPDEAPDLDLRRLRLRDGDRRPAAR